MEEKIIEDMMLILHSYMPYAILSGIIVIFIYSAAYWSFKKKKPGTINELTLKRIVLVYSMYVYLFLVVSITLLSRQPGSRTMVNLRLFSTFTLDDYGNAFVIENILLFIPLGSMLPLLHKEFHSAVACLETGFIFSVLIESMQYITKRGYLQTDDILLNFIGTGIGFLVYKRYQKSAERKRKVKKVT